MTYDFNSNYNYLKENFRHDAELCVNDFINDHMQEFLDEYSYDMEGADFYAMFDDEAECDAYMAWYDFDFDYEGYADSARRLAREMWSIAWRDGCRKAEKMAIEIAKNKRA